MPARRCSDGMTVGGLGERVSRQHQQIKRIRRLVRRAGDRASEGVYVVEGPRALDEVARHGAVIETILLADGTEPPVAVGRARSVLVVDADVLGSVADSSSPQGVLAVVERGHTAWPSTVRHAVVLDRLGDPGNVGTIVRAAAAFGAAVAVTTGSADPWGPKAVRASAGAIAVTPILSGDVDSVIAACHDRGLRLLGLAGDGVAGIDDVIDPVAWVVGSEAHGLSAEMEACLDARIAIATTDAVESLNAAMAASIALASSYRQVVRGRTG
ncbi:MAG: TrmH family RNA methyltransferase [Actinomycetota bacterium]